MRDRINLNQEKFNIQLSKKVISVVSDSGKFLSESVSATPTLLDDQSYSIHYPRNFRLLRALAISQWWFPEILHWRIWLDLTDMTFSWLSRKQIVELNVYLHSKEDCLKYLYWTDRFSGNEVFGNLLGKDLTETLKVLKITRKVKRKPRKSIWRRGYRDHGSRRPLHRWLPSEDYSFDEYQVLLEKERELTNKLINRILTILEKISD